MYAVFAFYSQASDMDKMHCFVLAIVKGRRIEEQVK
jgi:hypothetical protein